MTIKYEALLAPIETQEDDGFSVTIDGYGVWSFNPIPENDSFVYANVVHLVATMNSNSPSDISFGFNSDFKVTITASDTITAIGTDSGVINTALGGMSVSGTNTVTASNVSPYSWVPRYRSSDGRWFERESGQEFRGSRGVNGNLSGVSYSAMQSRNFQWPSVKAENAVERANEATANKALNCFEVALNYSRSRMLKYESSGNINIKGLWLISDRSEFIGTDLSGSYSAWDNGTPNVGDPLWVTTSAPDVGGNSNPRLNTYYDCSATLTAAPAPTWAIPSD